MENGGFVCLVSFYTVKVPSEENDKRCEAFCDSKGYGTSGEAHLCLKGIVKN